MDDKKELEAFKKRTDELIEALDALKESMSKHKKSAEVFSDAVKSIEEAKNSNVALNNQNSELIKRIEEYIAGLYELNTEKTISGITDFNTNVKQLESTTKTLTDYIAKVGLSTEKGTTKLSEQMAKVDSSIKDAKDIIPVTDDLRNDMVLYGKKTEELQKLMDSNTNAVLSLDERIAKLESSISDLRSENQKVRDDNVSLREQISKLIEKIDGLQNKQSWRKVKKGLSR